MKCPTGPPGCTPKQPAVAQVTSGENTAGSVCLGAFLSLFDYKKKGRGRNLCLKAQVSSFSFSPHLFYEIFSLCLSSIHESLPYVLFCISSLLTFLFYVHFHSFLLSNMNYFIHLEQIRERNILWTYTIRIILLRKENFKDKARHWR